MSEYTNMILKGALCVTCGVYMGSEVGYTRRCKPCIAEFARARVRAQGCKHARTRRTRECKHSGCATCGKTFAQETSLIQHCTAKGHRYEPPTSMED